MSLGEYISRSDGQALIPEAVANEIIQNAPQRSVALTKFKKVTMSTAQTRMPVLSVLPVAYWVDGDTGLKNQTRMAWANKYLDAQELAVLVPIPEAYLDDAGFDVWGEVRPRIEEAFGNALDSAVFFGVNKPTIWPAAIGPAAIAAGNTVTRSANAAAAGGLAGDISDAFSKVEQDGFDVNGIVAHTKYKGMLRQVRSTVGEQLDEVTQSSAYGVTIDYPMRGLWPTGSGAIEAIMGDYSQAIIGLRQDMRYKVLTEAVIQGQDGQIILNLAQQDMVALRVTIRCAYQVANPITLDQPNSANRFPFSVIQAP